MNRLICLLALLVCCVAHADEQESGVYVILDGSGSMWGQLPDGTHKITAAKEVLGTFGAEEYAGRELAFRVYGHRRKGDCADTELVVPFSSPERAIERMAAFAEGVNPKGKTPISRSLRAALADFDGRPGEIILVSDGIETCDEDPCALVREWRASGIDIRVHVVGLGLQDKERAAMECISDASGTEYRDARSADELSASLRQINQAKPAPEPDWRGLKIVATNSDGTPLRVQGTASWEGGGPVEVTSSSRQRLPVGEVELTVGVRTWNGNLYRPVTRKTTVAERGESKVEIVVPEPPSVRAKFVESGLETGGSHVYGYQNGGQVLGFRWEDRAYLDPGSYEFRSKPNADNELSVSESFVEGDHKEIVFELTQTVHAKIAMVSSGSEIEFASNLELWQNGEKKYAVHRHNGVQARPGIYDVRLPLRLTPYLHRGLEITGEAKQEHRIEVPVGHVTFRYRAADGSPMKDARCRAKRKDNDGKWVSDKNSQSGVRIPLPAGEYRVEGWSHLGDFDPIQFTIAVGDDKEIIMHDGRRGR